MACASVDMEVSLVVVYELDCDSVVQHAAARARANPLIPTPLRPSQFPYAAKQDIPRYMTHERTNRYRDRHRRTERVSERERKKDVSGKMGLS